MYLKVPKKPLCYGNHVLPELLHNKWVSDLCCIQSNKDNWVFLQQVRQDTFSTHGYNTVTVTQSSTLHP